MASGTISLGTSNQIQGRIKWSSSSNGTDANSSEVTATIQVKRTNSYTTTGTWTGSLTIDGTKKSYSKYKEVSDSYVTLYSFSKTVKHKDNGDGTCAISGVINGPSGTSQEDSKVSESKTVTLDTIARYATLTSVNNFTDEENTKIIYSHGAGSALDSLTLGISVNGSTDIITKEIPKTQSSCTIGFTDANRKLLREAASASNSKEFIFTLRSRLSGVDYESKKTAVMTVVNAAPTVEPNAVDVNTATIDVTGDAKILVAGYSQAKVTVNAAAYKEASVDKIQITNGSAKLSGDGVLNPVQNSAIRVTVTDSRGNTATKETQNTIVPYTPPSCFVENATLSGEGSMSLTVVGKFYNASIGKTANTLRVKCRIKADGADYSDWLEMDVSLSGNEYTADLQIEGLDYQKNHTLQAQAVDALATKQADDKTVVSIPVFGWSQSDFNFNVPVFFSGEEQPNNPLCIAENRVKNLQDPQDAHDAVSKDYLERATAPKLLWNKAEGWNSGTITVPDTDKYTAFLICMDGQGTVIQAFKHWTHIRGIGGYSQANDEATTYHFTATFSGNTWTFVACNGFKHYLDSDHGAGSARTVTEIWGFNGGAFSGGSSGGGTVTLDGAVRYDVNQTLANTQKATARNNIGAVSASDVATALSACNTVTVTYNAENGTASKTSQEIHGLVKAGRNVIFASGTGQEQISQLSYCTASSVKFSRSFFSAEKIWLSEFVIDENGAATYMELSASGGGTSTSVSATHDGNGNVILNGASMTHDGNGNVTLTGAGVTHDGAGNVTIS